MEKRDLRRKLLKSIAEAMAKKEGLSRRLSFNELKKIIDTIFSGGEMNYDDSDEEEDYLDLTKEDKKLKWNGLTSSEDKKLKWRKSKWM